MLTRKTNRMFPTIPIIYFLICGITGVVIWYKMLGILESKGRMVKYTWVTLGQWIKFAKVIKEEKDLHQKRKYRILLWIQVVLIPTFFIGEIILIILTK